MYESLENRIRIFCYPSADEGETYSSVSEVTSESDNFPEGSSNDDE
jgi:hypothetical protein